MKIEYEEGVVEDNNDPEGKARVKVRLYRYHTQMDELAGETFGLSVDDLDWSPVLMPTTSSSRGGRGIAPSGLMIGDRVSVLILDSKFVQSFIVIGTVHGDGDISNISYGGIDALESDPVRNVNNNLTVAPDLNSEPYVKDGMEVDDVGYDTFYDSLVMDEGFVDHTYYDQFRYPHIGIGTLLIKKSGYSLDRAWSIVEQKLGRRIPNKRITREDGNRLAKEYLAVVESEIPKYPLLATAYYGMSKTRQYAILSMCYQIGIAGVAKFVVSLNCMIAEDWVGAYRNMTNSKWARQTPTRAKRVASIIRDNNFNAYPMKSGRTRNNRNSAGSQDGISDISLLQTQIMESTKMIRAFGQINSLDDIMKIVNIVLNFDKFINQVTDTIKQLKKTMKTVREIDAMEFINKYLQQFKDEIKKLLERVKQYAIYMVDKTIEDAKQTIENVKAMIKIIEFTIKKLFSDINKLGSDISDAFENLHATLFEEAPEEEENGVLFSEPPTEYAGMYPHVKTEISESGNLREVDDTPGFERIKEYHRTGTYREINSNGRLAEKVVSDRYIVVANDDHLFIEGSGKITIGGNHIINIIGDSVQVVNGNLKQVVRGDINQDVAGNVKSVITGNTDLNVKGNVTELIEGNVDTTVKGNVVSLVEGNVNSTVKGNVESLIEGDFTSTVKGNSFVTIEGTFTGNVVGDATLDIEGEAYANFYSNTYINCKADLSAVVEANANIEVYGNLESTVDGNWDMEVGGDTNITTVGTLGLFASRINMDKS